MTDKKVMIEIPKCLGNTKYPELKNITDIGVDWGIVDCHDMGRIQILMELCVANEEGTNWFDVNEKDIFEICDFLRTPAESRKQKVFMSPSEPPVYFIFNKKLEDCEIHIACINKDYFRIHSTSCHETVFTKFADLLESKYAEALDAEKQSVEKHLKKCRK